MARPSTFKFNERYFECINTPEKAYFLGLLFADGYLDIKRNKLTLNLQERDKELIYGLNSELTISENSPIYFINANERFKTKQNQCALIITNKNISKDLQALGMTNNKTFDAKMPDLENSLIKYFILGYFDGDGCFMAVSKKNKYLDSSWQITGTKDMVSKIQDFLIEKLSLNKVQLHKTKSSNKGIFKLKYGGNINCKKITDFLYTGASFFLKRKKEKIDSMFIGYKTVAEKTKEIDDKIFRLRTSNITNSEICRIMDIKQHAIFSSLKRRRKRV